MQQKTFLTILSIFIVRKHCLVVLPEFLLTPVNVDNVFTLIFLRLISHHSIPQLLTFYMTFHRLTAETHTSLEDMQRPSRYDLIRKPLSLCTHQTWHLIISQTFICLQHRLQNFPACASFLSFTNKKLHDFKQVA